MTKHKEEKLGELAGLMELTLYAFWPTAAHYGATVLPQIQFLAVITLISSLIFFATTSYKREFRPLFNTGNILWMTVYTIFFITLPYAIIVYATRFSNAIDTTILMQAEVIFAAVIGYFFLGEAVQRNKLLGIAAILMANLAIVYSGTLAFSLANLSIALAPLLFVVGNIIAKKLQREGVGWSPLLLFRSVLGGLALLVFSYFTENGFQPIPQRHWAFILFTAIFIFGLSKMFWQLALHRLDVSKATALGLAYPLPSLFIAYFWLGEIPTSYQWFGAVFMMIGIALLLRTRSKQWLQSA